MASVLAAPEPEFPLTRISVAQYHRMIDSGAFGENDRVELLEGLVVDKMPKKRGHSLATRRLDRRLTAVLPDGWDVLNQEPITLLDSEPEPDVFVVRGSGDDYRRHPGPGDVLLIAEVADTSLALDRRKGRIYARARIPVYWLVNLPQRCVEVYTVPRGAGGRANYSKTATYKLGDMIPVQIEGRRVAEVPVADLLP
jgi:Uma2 family endonuclease